MEISTTLQVFPNPKFVSHGQLEIGDEISTISFVLKCVVKSVPR